MTVDQLVATAAIIGALTAVVVQLTRLLHVAQVYMVEYRAANAETKTHHLIVETKTTDTK